MQRLDNHICVAYLVRVGEPYTNLHNFIDSFSEHEPGIECDLHIIFKGFSEYNLGDVYTDPLKDIRHTKLFLPDIGIDIDTYFEVATKTCYNYYFFLNSHSIIISPNWLLKIYIVGSKRDVGLTGATGSWGTVGSEISWGLFLFLLATKKNAFQAVLEFCTLAINRLNHPTFPNPHIRTNSFFIRRDIFLESFPGFLGNKRNAYRFESGNHSLTRKVLKKGLSVFILGVDGTPYAPDKFYESSTFWVGEQENLLISDNQTRKYETGSIEERDRLMDSAWHNGERRKLTRSITDFTLIKRKSVIIYGASKAGLNSAHFLRNKCNLVCFVDSDNRLSGEIVMGLKVYSSDLLNLFDFDFICIASQYWSEILNHLTEKHRVERKKIFMLPVDIRLTGKSFFRLN